MSRNIELYPCTTSCGRYEKTWIKDRYIYIYKGDEEEPEGGIVHRSRVSVYVYWEEIG